ncbi:MAG: hypothetical protein KF893_13705 [Caldilineaceae bacterium]|nr:hypothetical protein [Caldilineaceae bacterium]
MKLARSTVLDWQILDEEKPQNDQSAAPTGSDPAHSVRRGRAVQLFVGLLLIVAAGTLFYLWRLAEAGAQIVESELRTTVIADAGRRLPPPSRQADAGAPAAAATVQVQGFTFHGKVASVHTETTVTEPGGQRYSMRQRHFYQPSQTGWIRVRPNSALLGERQRRQTAYFSFAYYQIDSTAVAAAAAEADRVYADLRRDYGLPPAVERVVVEVTAEPYRESTCRLRNHLCLQSPALASLPVELSETEALELWFVNALAYSVSRAAVEATSQREPFHSPFKVGWRHTVYVLPRVQMRRHSNLLSAWQTTLTRWLYSIEARAPQPDAEMLAQELAHLCAAHQIAAYQSVIANAAPTDLCVAPPMWDLRYLANHHAPDRLDHLFMPDFDLTVTDPSWIDLLAFETVLDYVVATYGDDALFALVEGFRRYDTWNTLIPAVFAVSAEEFERGWQGYLKKLGEM